jgi:hypothetical protein
LQSIVISRTKAKTLGTAAQILRDVGKMPAHPVAKLRRSRICFIPSSFNKDVASSWPGITLKPGEARPPLATREQVYAFAHGCIECDEVECAVVAVMCFEWLTPMTSEFEHGKSKPYSCAGHAGDRATNAS